MIVDGLLTIPHMAEVAGCSNRTVNSIRANLGSTTAPHNSGHYGGRPRSFNSPVLGATREHLFRSGKTTWRQEVIGGTSS